MFKVQRNFMEDMSDSIFDKQLIKSTDRHIEFFTRGQTPDTVTETNMKDPGVFQDMLFKIVAIQFRLVGLEGAELLKYEDYFGLEFMITDRSYLFIGVSDMDLIGRRYFERKLLIPITISPYENFKVVLHVGCEPEDFDIVKGQISLVGFKRLTMGRG